MGKSMHKGHYGHYTGNYKFSKDHAHTRVTKENYKATERDDAAHIDYLKRDIDYDAHHGHSDEKMTADEKHISKLAGDMKYDKEHHGSPAKNIVGAVGKAAKMAAKAAQGYNLSKIREQAKEAIKVLKVGNQIMCPMSCLMNIELFHYYQKRSFQQLKYLTSVFLSCVGGIVACNASGMIGGM